MTRPDMEEKVQKIIREVLFALRRSMTRAAASAMDSDPRQAQRAVRTMVYKRILGGNVNILQKKRGRTQTTKYEPTRTLKTGQRGGNRRKRSERTMKLESYYGSSRAFVLRFQNSGTQERGVKFNYNENRSAVHRGSRGGNLQKYGKTINTGRRGSITGTNWFGKRAHSEMEVAAQNLSLKIDQLIQKELNNG